MRIIFFIFISASLLYFFFFNEKKFSQMDFDSCIGGEKKIENLIVTKADSSAYRHYKYLYENRQQTGGSIPKIFHFFCFSSQLSKKERESIASFQKKHPGWKFICWSNKLKTAIPGVELLPMKNFLEEPLYSQFKISTNRDEKKLILALLALKKHGGIAVDLPAKCIQSLEGLIAGHAFFIGLNPLEEPLFGNSLKLSFSLIGSNKESALLDRISQGIDSALKSLYIENNSEESAKGYGFHYCCYQPFEKEVMKESEGVAIYPPGYFQANPKGFSAFVLPEKRAAAANATFETKLVEQFKKIEKTQKIIFIIYGIILVVFLPVFIKRLYRYAIR